MGTKHRRTTFPQLIVQALKHSNVGSISYFPNPVASNDIKTMSVCVCLCAFGLFFATITKGLVRLGFEFAQSGWTAWNKLRLELHFVSDGWSGAIV